MKTKHILFTIALFLSVAFMNAQDKYEFMIVEYNTFRGRISISMDNIKFTEEEVKLSKEEKSKSNANPFLQRIKDFQNENWEVMSISSTFNGTQGNIDFPAHFAHLRRKIK